MASDLKNWPVAYPKELLVGNSDASVAVCCLWSDKRVVARVLGLGKVALIGNLYSHGPGIEGIIRNILAKPTIRNLIIAGNDRSGSGRTLLSFFENGVEKTELGWTIKMADEQKSPIGNRTFDGVIPLKAINRLRQAVKVEDLRDCPWTEIRRRLSKYKVGSAFAKPVVYPQSKSTQRVMFGEGSGFVFRNSKPHLIWLELLRTIRSFGHSGKSRYSHLTQEVLNVVSVVEDGSISSLMRWPKEIPLDRIAVKKYARQLIEGKKLGPDDTYAYGERMRVKQGDQIGAVIEKLKSDPGDRGHLVDLWDVESDFFGKPDSPPCLTQVWFRVCQDKLTATFIYRSHDIAGAWLIQALALRLLQNYVAKQSGTPLGKTTIISCSAHIYEHDWSRVDGILKRNLLSWKFNDDPRGNFIVSLEKDKIIVRHENQSGAVNVLVGKTAADLRRQICQQGLILFSDHAMYLGHELARAEICLKNKTPYRQDRA